MPTLNSKWMVAESHATGLNVKPKWYVGNCKSGLLLGVAEWYAPWRRYCFSPATNTVFSDDCLKALADFCRDATAEVKRPCHDVPDTRTKEFHGDL